MTRSRWLFPLVAVVLAGCKGGNPTDSASGPHDLGANVERPGYSQSDRDHAAEALTSGTGHAVVTATNGFGFRLMTDLCRREGRKNVFISPASVALALDMTYNGASGDTKVAMAKTLGVQGIALDDFNAAAHELQALLINADPKVELNIANSLWGKAGCEFKQDFLDRNKRYYDAHLSTLDFASPQAVPTINAWVFDKTHGKIESILDRIPPAAVLILVNAVHFKGEWQDKFLEEYTKEKPFHLADGTVIQHPLMSTDGDYKYLRGTGFEALQVPYGHGFVSMYIFLPSKSSSLDRFLAGVNEKNWREWAHAFRRGTGRVIIPRFRSKYGATLDEPLRALGMAPAFEGGGLEGIGGGASFLTEVRHKTYVNVDEQGTEAAAATAVPAASAAPPRLEPFTFVADRPFFYAICERDTGAILFMGVLWDPRG